MSKSPSFRLGRCQSRCPSALVVVKVAVLPPWSLSKSLSFRPGRGFSSSLDAPPRLLRGRNGYGSCVSLEMSSSWLPRSTQCPQLLHTGWSPEYCGWGIRQNPASGSEHRGHPSQLLPPAMSTLLVSRLVAVVIGSSPLFHLCAAFPAAPPVLTPCAPVFPL